MFTLRQTAEFREWFKSLRDDRARRRIAQWLNRLEGGLFGDAKFFEGVGKLKIDHGPGCRVYFVRREAIVVILPCGGDKSSRKRDIKRAIAGAQEV